jgi:ribosomal protein S18 acetylase RimI-like enzyme
MTDTALMSGLTVRPAKAEDQPYLARIYRQASLSNLADRVALLAHPEILELQEESISEEWTRVAVAGSGTILGFVTMRPTAQRDLEIEDLFVDPDWQRLGVGRALLGRVVAEARDGGVRRLEVIGNPHALGFYRALGFVVIGEVSTEFGPALRLRLDVTDP